jgi:Arc/MetJ-type ribon-helix-helix transcriptional regulator
MPEDGKKRMTVWVDQQDREDMKLIEASVGLASESAAIRYAVKKLAREIRVEEARVKRASR